MSNVDGAEPIDFRAALAAFESNRTPSTSTSTSNTAILRSPIPRALAHGSTSKPASPQTPARSSSGGTCNPDPVPRSSSTPRIRKISENGLLSAPSSNNPFSSLSSPLAAQPTTSASGMLSAHPPSALSPRYTANSLRKSGSGLSLKELANRSLPRNANGGSIGPSASPMVRNRSRSVVEQHHEGVGLSSAPNSGRTSPHQRGLDGWNRTDSPAGTNTHELDTSAEDAMFAHAVMDRSSSPSLVPPQVSSRKGSASSTHSTSSITPKLPPRPPAGGGAGGSLAPSPTISEFGQFPNTTPAKTKGGVGVRYATYSPGVKKSVGGGGVGREGGVTPPALPPRSATLGGERGRVGASESAYRARQKSPSKAGAPSIPRKPTAAATSSSAGGVVAKPTPPPRPTKPTSGWEGNAGGFKFGSTPTNTASAGTNSDRGAVSPQRHTRNPSTGPSTTVAAAHRKTGSNVFTSISLTDDASSELKRSLESGLHSDHCQRMPPRRPPRNTTPFRSPNNTLSGQTGVVGVASSLIGTAASALPLFKPGGAGMGGGTRSLADGAPSKQFGGVGLGRSASTHSDLSVRPGDGSGARGRVQLADPPTSTPLSRGKGALEEPRDAAARARYEDLFSSLVSQQRMQRRRTKAKEGEGDSSNASTVCGGSSSKIEEGSGAASALRGWFESDSHPSSNPTTDGNGRAAVLSAKMVQRVWSKCKLPESFLAGVYDQSSSSSSSSSSTPAGLGKENFARAMATIDAELERRKAKRERRKEAKAKRASTMGLGLGRRVPPLPPSAASGAIV
ncbi:hypothetical protein NDA13_003094 [Ustilago tritici]|nr:hypothetical protein NDA13_003094 [Ustilago tritici]